MTSHFFLHILVVKRPNFSFFPPLYFSLEKREMRTKAENDKAIKVQSNCFQLSINYSERERNRKGEPLREQKKNAIHKKDTDIKEMEETTKKEKSWRK